MILKRRNLAVYVGDDTAWTLDTLTSFAWNGLNLKNCDNQEKKGNDTILQSFFLVSFYFIYTSRLGNNGVRHVCPVGWKNKLCVQIAKKI